MLRLRWGLTFSLEYGIIYMSRGEARWHRAPHDAKGSTPCTDECENLEKIFEKTFQKPLDEPQKCGTIHIIKPKRGKTKMTVKDLIANLEEMPQDAKIELEIIDWLERSTSTNSSTTYEIYESITDTVVIQGIK